MGPFDLWQPETGQVVRRHDLNGMQDDGRATDIAYGVAFRLAEAPDARIMIWTYVVHAPDDMPGCYQVRYQCQYQLAGEVVAYSGDDDAEFYDSMLDCDDSARDVAEQMASAVRRHDDAGPCADWELFFDWDGRP